MSKQIYALIPARLGSERLKLKNLALLEGEPLVAHAIKTARETEIFDEVILSSDGEIFREVASRYGASFHLRSSDNATSDARTDHVVAEFGRSFPQAEIIVWVNPVCPLQTSEEVRAAVEFFESEELDSLITAENRQVHASYDGAPLNFFPAEPFAKTQDLKSVDLFAYSTMIWRRSTFFQEFEERGYGIFCGKFGAFPTSRWAATMVKTEEDLAWVAALMRSREVGASGLQYDSLAGI